MCSDLSLILCLITNQLKSNMLSGLKHSFLYHISSSQIFRGYCYRLLYRDFIQGALILKKSLILVFSLKSMLTILVNTRERPYIVISSLCHWMALNNFVTYGMPYSKICLWDQKWLLDYLGKFNWYGTCYFQLTSATEPCPCCWMVKFSIIQIFIYLYI